MVVTQHKKITGSKPNQTKKCLFTIGYEGRTIDEYLNLLTKNNIKVLCDVRKNPISRKSGFSKRALQTRIESLGMAYIHIPEFGIDSKRRQHLTTEQDYKKLFTAYKKDTLPYRKKEFQQIVKLLNTKKRVALTCFEETNTNCHRHCISDRLEKLIQGLDVQHL